MADTNPSETVAKRKVYIINVLTTWQGDHFNDSYSYDFFGVTTDQELAKYLKTLRVSKDVADHSRWPKACMSGFPWYQIDEVEEKTIDDIKVGRSAELMQAAKEQWDATHQQSPHSTGPEPE